MGLSGRFALDVWYVDHWSLGKGLGILLLTIQRVVGGRRVEPPATGEPDPFQSRAGFEGSAPEGRLP